jgi:hypothetical protein
MLATERRNGNSSPGFAALLAAASSALVLAALSVGCGKPFNVKTQPGLPPARYVAKASVDSITVEAQAITDEDFLYDTFDANLISGGVFPVRVMLTNAGDEAIELKRARFEVQAAAGRSFRSADTKKAFKQLISYYGISVYSKSGYKESLESFSAYALDVATPLGGRQTRQGLVFVLMPAEVARAAGLTLVIGKLSGKQSNDGAGVVLKLN